MTMEVQPVRHDSLLDVAADDRANGHGGTRRPGNLWTAQAREDMFKRREAGETWETICIVSSHPASKTLHRHVDSRFCALRASHHADFGSAAMCFD